MNIARASVRRPVFTCMVTLAVVVLGTLALTRLQIDLLAYLVGRVLDLFDIDPGLVQRWQGVQQAVASAK